MKTTIQILLAVNILVPILFAYRQCRSVRGIEVNHVMMFSMGFVYYWITPILAGQFVNLDTSELLGPWRALYDAVTPEQHIIYLIFSLLFYLAFAVGVWYGDRTRLIPGGTWCQPRDVRDFGALARRWREGNDPVSRMLASLLASHLPEPMRVRFDAFDTRSSLPPELCAAMLETMNRWLNYDVANDAPLRGALSLSPDTQSALNQRPQGELRARVNHLVLQEVYPAEMVARLRLRSRWENVRFDVRVLNVFLLIGLALSAVFVVILRNDLFHGYKDSLVYINAGPRGTFVAVSEFLLAVSLLYVLYAKPLDQYKRFNDVFKNHFMLSYLAVAILILSMGGRLYFVSTLIMMFIFRTVYYKPVAVRSLLISLVVMASGAGLIGSLRMGGKGGLLEVLGSVLVEPLGTSTSLLSFLAAARFELLNFPVLLMFDFTNLIPASLLPNKATLQLTPADLGYNAYSPLGAMHSASSFMMNFGMLGSLVVVFLLGFALSQLKKTRIGLFRVMYIMISGWLCFTFFRDPFSMSIVKSIFQFSILVPWLMVFLGKLISDYLAETGTIRSENGGKFLILGSRH